MQPPLFIPILSEDGVIPVNPDEVEVFKFFVPTRLVWPVWPEFFEKEKNNEQVCA